eukprot:scaffold18805_cov24-Phaeocystis_antarctica.AAC.1
MAHQQRRAARAAREALAAAAAAATARAARAAATAEAHRRPHVPSCARPQLNDRPPPVHLHA